MTVCCVLAVHNEAKYLPYSLPSLKSCSVEGLVVVLDRCKDDSLRLITQLWKGNLSIFQNEVKPKWKNPCAEMKSYGCEWAKYGNDSLLLVSDADMILDSEAIHKAVLLFKRRSLDAVCFVYKQYSLNGSVFARFKDEVSNLFNIATRKLGIHPTRTGIYMIHKEKAVITDNPSEYDSVQQRLTAAFLITNSLHLRPRYDRQSQLSRGKTRAHYRQYSFWKVLVASVLQFQPYMIAGYLQEKQCGKMRVDA